MQPEIAQKPARYLIACDFDGTLFDTFAPSPNGLSIQKAYELALHDIYGDYGDMLQENGGLQNRTPTEITSLYLENQHVDRSAFLQSAQQFSQTPDGQVGHFLPECASADIVWENPEKAATQLLVGRKLALFLDEIGKRDANGNLWPQPCGDALIFLYTAARLRDEGMPLDVAIISSGHDSFIQKTLDVWGATYPQVLVSEDTIRPRKFPASSNRRFKPAAFPLALAHFAWLNQQGVTEPYQQAAESRQRILYIGDSKEKDLAMAERSRVTGMLYPQTEWRNITSQLLANRDLFDGRPIAEALSMTSHTETTTLSSRAEQGLGYQARK